MDLIRSFALLFGYSQLFFPAGCWRLSWLCSVWDSLWGFFLWRQSTCQSRTVTTIVSKPVSRSFTLWGVAMKARQEKWIRNLEIAGQHLLRGDCLQGSAGGSFWSHLGLKIKMFEPRLWWPTSVTQWSSRSEGQKASSSLLPGFGSFPVSSTPWNLELQKF